MVTSSVYMVAATWNIVKAIPRNLVRPARGQLFTYLLYVPQVVSSKLNLVDLAGSERLKKALDQVRACMYLHKWGSMSWSMCLLGDKLHQQKPDAVDDRHEKTNNMPGILCVGGGKFCPLSFARDLM